jgi:hypothetical protein
MTDRRRALAAAAVVFVVYQCTLTLSATAPFSEFAPFGADNHRSVFTELASWHPLALYQAKKHPLFVAVTVPLHAIGKAIYGTLPSPHDSNFALAFPVALLGGANAGVAYALLRTIGFGPRIALLPTAFYAGSASLWYFGSFPDTYMLTTLLTNLFLLAFLKDHRLVRWKRLAAINALACFSTPQQIVLAVVPCVQQVRMNGVRAGLPRCVRYVGALCLLYVVPFLLFLTTNPKGAFKPRKAAFAYEELVRWSSFDNFRRMDGWFAPAASFVLAAQVAPDVPTEMYNPLTPAAYVEAPRHAWALSLCVLAYVVFGLARGWKGGRLPGSVAILLFCVAYGLFFVFFNPGEAFLYSAPIVMPLWLLVHAGYVPLQGRRRWLLAFGALCVAVLANNADFLSGFVHASPPIAGL